jgi:hypothetical protein
MFRDFVITSSLLACWFGTCACVAPVEDPTSTTSEAVVSKASPAPAALPVRALTPSMAMPVGVAMRAGCTNDAECNDGNACTKDVCDGDTHLCRSTLIDADGDGYASITLGSCGTDCNDENADVHPNQAAFFATPYTTIIGSISYDYDCDGSETKEHADFGYCIGAATPEESTCTCTTGWRDEVPSCGGSGEFAGASKCGDTKITTAIQGCR